MIGLLKIRNMKSKKQRIKELEQRYSDLQALQETTQKLVEAQDSTIDGLRKAVKSYANEAERAHNRLDVLTKSYQSICKWIR